MLYLADRQRSPPNILGSRNNMLYWIEGAFATRPAHDRVLLEEKLKQEDKQKQLRKNDVFSAFNTVK
uniref:Transposase n=1 Tax=Elaeophora elaphi TaxID=1147741 RepID=A0A0R3RSD7_9BILA